jgi:hypothetical protein
MMPATQKLLNKARSQVAGLSVVFIVLGGWILLRSTVVLLLQAGAMGVQDAATDTSPSVLAKAFAFTHLPLAAFTIYAAFAMMRFRRWTRPYFMGLLALVGAEVAVAAVLMALDTEDGGVALLSAARIVNLVAMLLMAGLAWALAWRLHKDAMVRKVFEGQGEVED